MLQLLEEGVVYETITAFSAAGCHATPLGIVRRGEKLYAWLYPGTRLHANPPRNGCAAISLPADPLDIPRYLLGQQGSRFNACCPLPSTPYILIEARLEGSTSCDDGRIMLEMKPVHVRRVVEPRPYTRLTACLIELLIAYTRLDLNDDCEAKKRRLASIEACNDLLQRRATGEHEKLYKRLLEEIRAKLQPCEVGKP